METRELTREELVEIIKEQITAIEESIEIAHSRNDLGGALRIMEKLLSVIRKHNIPCGNAQEMENLLKESTARIARAESLYDSMFDDHYKRAVAYSATHTTSITESTPDGRYIKLMFDLADECNETSKSVKRISDHMSDFLAGCSVGILFASEVAAETEKAGCELWHKESEK